MTGKFLLLQIGLLFASQTLAFNTPAPCSSMHRRIFSGSCLRKGLSPLNAVTLPPEEDEKKKKGNTDWTETEGGFIPNILRRKQKRRKVEVVDNIMDYKEVVVNEKEDMVVVRFYADWCRSCKASKPLFNRLVSKFSDSGVKFVEVPLTKQTAYLQEGLGVPSVPFSHIYHPQAGLVEELKISKPHFRKFGETLESYVVGSCNLPEDDEDKNSTDEGIFGVFE
jgi:thiol-disulfide isomerase/thioredoxin